MNEKDIANVKKPELVVFAGPNGSGKSTITDVLRPAYATYINQDEIKKFLQCSDMEALEISLKLKNKKRMVSRLRASCRFDSSWEYSRIMKQCKKIVLKSI